MDFYIDFVTTYPFTSAITQFAVLGTLGEILATKLAGKKGFLTLYFVLSKALVWGILAVPIKIAFIGFEGFVARVVTGKRYGRICICFGQIDFHESSVRSIPCFDTQGAG